MGTTSAHVLGGRYRLVSLRARGGMAAVWAGIDTRLDRSVAVKVLIGAASSDHDMLRRLDQEAHTLAKLAHPNIVSVYDLGTDDGVPYVVMELVEGDDLHQRVTHGPLDIHEAVGIAAQVCDALEAAHDAGVVHRDIKPANILLTTSGVVKVCDFGIARLQQQSGHSGGTSSATAIGTAMYMAPEQATGGVVDARSDLYALGCVLYATLTGQPPFPGDNPMRVLWQQVHEAPVPVAMRRPDVPRELDALVAELLAKNPNDRPRSAGQVRDRLAHLVEPLPLAPTTRLPSATTAAAHGRAIVRPKTMRMPTVGETGQHRASQGFRLGPAGIAAVAVGVAIVTTLVIAFLMTRTQPAAQTGLPPGATSNSAPASPTPPATSTGTLESVRAVIQAQTLAGELNADTANDLLNRLNDIDRDLAKGQTNKAREKIVELSDRLDELARDDKITAAGHTAILQSLDQLADGLPTRGND